MAQTDLDGLAQFFEQAGADVRDEVRKVTFKGGMNVKRKAQSLAPRRVPHGTDINMEIKDSGDEIAAEVETRSGFGAIMEFGSPTLPGGRPHMLPALESESEAFEKFIDQAVTKLFR